MLSLKLGPLVISIGQGVMLLALLVALAVGKFANRKRDISIGDTLFNITLAGLVSARVVFVARYYSSYGMDPLAWIDIRDGGFDLIGGLVGLTLFASYVALREAPQRRPLGISLLAGALTWVGATGALSLVENQAAQAPETQLYTLDGTPVDLPNLQEQYGNRPVVVNLWATWCPPCRAEMPVLEEAQNAHPDILFVLANQYENAATVRAFLDQTQLKFDHVLLDEHGDVAKQAGSVALPTTLFYDSEGHLVDNHVGQLSKATLLRAIERL